MGWISEDLAADLPETEVAARLRANRRALSLGVTLVAAVDVGLAFALTQTRAPLSLRLVFIVLAVPFGLLGGWIMDRAMPLDAYRQAARQAKRDGRAAQVLTRLGLVAFLAALAVVGFGAIYALALATAR
jgi:hypothetical protein